MARRLRTRRLPGDRQPARSRAGLTSRRAPRYPGEQLSTPLDYAAWRATRLGRITETLERSAILELAGSVEGLDVLDAGCGDGAYAVSLAERGARVTGLDASPSALRAAAGRARGASAPLALVAGDAVKLPFEDEAFDLAIVVTALCFVPDPQQALAELARVLRPGGRLVVGELGRWSAWAAWRRARALLGASAWRGTHFFTASGLRRLAADAGLVPGRVRGSVFHPPIALAAVALAPLDPLLGRASTLGAAFLALEAVKPATRRGEPKRAVPRP
jgi:SAM-dependent methyltransferase